MANLERFPTSKYVRQLWRMADELGEWQSMYSSAAYLPDADRRKAKYEDREAVLAEAIHEVFRLIDTLRSIPRLS